jgi:DNA polymerase-1
MNAPTTTIDAVREPVGDELRSRAAARGRYGRNALVQGAAAEFFKMWAAIVRVRTQDLGGRIVLCLHDELLVETPVAAAEDVASIVAASVGEAGHRWLASDPGVTVRFVADVSTVRRWSEAT